MAPGAGRPMGASKRNSVFQLQGGVGTLLSQMHASGAGVDAIRIEVRGAGGAGATPGHRGGNAALRRLRPNGHEPPRWRRGSRPGTCWPAGVPKRSSRRTG